MLSFIKSRWVLLSVIALFIVFKIHHLYYPYFWDESWPYASAVAYMYEHGISLIPGSVDPELSRGHPLFFHAAAALWGKLFGMSHLSMHSFALGISILFLVTIYEAALNLFNKRVAVMSLLLVCTQVLFIVQSGFLLLEMLVALLALLSLYHYIKGNYLQTGVYLSMLFYTKESGLIMGFVLGIDALVGLRRLTDTTWKKHVPRLLAIGIPCILMGIFFLLQKQINGWYILPLYTQLVEHKWDNFWHVFSKNAMESMYVSDYRFWYFFIAAGLTVYASIVKKMYGAITIVVPILLIYLLTGDQGPHNYADSLIHFIGLLISFAVFTWFISRPALFPSLLQRRFLILTMSFTVCFIIFSSMNFFTYRYLLATIIPGLMVVAIITDKMAEKTQPVMFYISLAAMLGVSAYAYIHDDGNGDTDRSAFMNMELQQSAVDYLEERKLYNEPIGTGSFLQRVHLTDKATGFLRGTTAFKKVDWNIDYATYIIVDNIEPDYRYDQIKNRPGYKLAFRKAKGLGWIEIYERIEK